MHRSGYYRLERQLPGGIRTRKESAPFHGARKKPCKSLVGRTIYYSCRQAHICRFESAQIPAQSTPPKGV